MSLHASPSAVPALPLSASPAPLAACASHLEDQFSRVIARQSLQDDELATLNTQLTSLQAKLRAMQERDKAPIPAPPTHTVRRGHVPGPVPGSVGAGVTYVTGKEKHNDKHPDADADLAVNTAPDLNAGLYRLEARMDRQDAQIRALTLAVEALGSKVSEQNTQLAQIVAARPDAQIAALRTELGDMGRWCERFNSAHERTLARCAMLEVKLSEANAEVARLREAARAQSPEHEEEKVNAPVHRQVVGVRSGHGGGSRRSCTPRGREALTKAARKHAPQVAHAPSLPELPSSAPIAFPL